jgi:CHAT domain-containing protein
MLALVLCFAVVFSNPQAFARVPGEGQLKALEDRTNAYFQTRDYARAFAICLVWAKGVEQAEAAKGRTRDRTAAALGTVAWYALFAKQPQMALAEAGRALELKPGTLWIASNRAHALLFLSRTSEAIKAYVEHKGETVPDQGKWEEVILKDFAEFRARRLTSRKFTVVEQALAAAPQDPKAELETLSSRVAALYRQGKFFEALPLAERYETDAKALYGENAPKYATALSWLATLLQATNRLAEAELRFRRALAISEKSLGPDHPDVAPHHNNLAQLLQATNRLAEAEPLYRRALKIDEKSLGPDHPTVAIRLNNLAQLLQDTNRLAEAEPLMRRALKIDEKSLGPDHPAVATDLNNLAELLKATNRLAEAEPPMRRALAIDEKSLGPDHPDVARELNNLALLLKTTNRLAEAEPLMRRALKIDEKSLGPDHPTVAIRLNNLALLLQDTNRLAEAEPLMRRALKIDEKSLGPDHPAVATDLNNLALLLRDTNRLAEAEPLTRRALAIDEKSLGPDHPDVARDLNNLALLLKATNRLAEAVPPMRRALAIDEKSLGPDHPYVASDLNNLAGLLEAQNKWVEAVALYARAKPIMIAAKSSREYERSTLEKAVLARNTGNLRAYTRALYRANAADLANLGEGFELAQWALQNSAADALSSMAARFAKGDAKLAKLVRQQQNLTAEREAAYRSLDAAAGKADAEAAKAARTRIADLETKLVESQEALRQVFPDYAELANPKPLTLVAAQALLGDNQSLVLFLDLWQIGKVPEETLVFALTRKDIRWASIPLGTRALREGVTALRCGLDDSQWRQGQDSRAVCKRLLNTQVNTSFPDYDRPPFDAALAHMLYRTLFGSIEELIKNKALLIVPSGPLTQLPFEVLVTAKLDATAERFKAYQQAAWLGQRQAITMLPSVGSLKALSAAKASGASEPFLGFGNPLLIGSDGGDQSAFAKQTCGKAAPPKRSQIASLIFKGLSLFRGGEVNVEDLRHQPPLPETADELCAVGRGLGVPEASLDHAIYLGSRATVSQVKALSNSGELAKARVVHFATHGLLAGETALFAKNKAEPALLLTPPSADEASEEDNGLLTASEVAQLNLNADWVVMSACNTAAGQGENAEALSGLARAFFYAGARSLLVSHWPVNSEAAVAITTSAVNTMKADPKIGRAEALRRSISMLISNGGDDAHPSVWAPFVLVGNGGI